MNYPSRWLDPVVRCILVANVIATCPVPVYASCGNERSMVPPEVRMEVIRESGDWRCIEIPGFLIYTRLPDANSRAFADELRWHNLVLAALRSEENRFQSTTNQIPVVLRLLQPLVDGRNRSVEAYDDEVSLMYVVYLPSVVPAGTASPIPPSPINLPGIPGGIPGNSPAPPPVERFGGAPTPAETLGRDAFARRMRYSRPKPPEWLLHGMDRLMQETRVLGSSLQFGPSRTRPAVPTGPIEEIFTEDFTAADELRHEALMRQSALFLRWTLVAEPERRETLWGFAVTAARAPVTEAIFDRSFGMSYGELGVVLTDSRLRRARLDTTTTTTGLQLSQLRTANEEEVARLLRTIDGLNERAVTHNAALAAVR